MVLNVALDIGGGAQVYDCDRLDFHLQQGTASLIKEEQTSFNRLGRVRWPGFSRSAVCLLQRRFLWRSRSRLIRRRTDRGPRGTVRRLTARRRVAPMEAL